MTIEEQLKAEILNRYRSVRAFTQSVDIPYSTIDTMLKKGFSGTSIQTMIKICNALDIDIESIEYGTLRHKKSPATEEPSAEDDRERKRLLKNYDDLNEEGREKLLEQSEFLVSSGKYKRNIKNNPPNLGKEA